MHIVVSTPNDINIAEFLGKKGTEGSITFYNRVVNDNVLVALYPQNTDANIIPLAKSMLVSDIIVISTANLDKLFGEIIIGASLLNKHIIFTDDNDIKKFINELNITNFEITSKDKLLDAIINYSATINKVNVEENARIDIDRAFPVKGVGTVALGIVTKGTIKVHDNLYHSTGNIVSVRSLQVHDVDIEQVSPKMRVGVALKGITHEQIESGDLLTKLKIPKIKELNAKLKFSFLTKNILKKEAPYQIVSNFMHVDASIIKEESDKTVFNLSRECTFEKNDEFLLVQNKTPRIIASGIVV